MKIQLFLNKKGLIHGANPHRIECEVDGCLVIGGTEITVKPNEDCVLPTLFYGATGTYDASYKTNDGVYNLGRVSVLNGRIQPPPATAVEIMELTCRADFAELERDRMKQEIEDLKHIFDTDSLNFLIK